MWEPFSKTSLLLLIYNPKKSGALVAHAYNPSYSGSRDKEDQSHPGQIICETLSQKKPIIQKKKNVGGVVQGVGPEFKPQCCKKEKEKTTLSSVATRGYEKNPP
jgi:hypothetical protein